MTDYATRYTDDPTARELIERLIDAGDELSDDLREDILAAGDEAEQALIDLVDDGELAMMEAPGEGWAGIHAVILLGKREATDAIDVLVDLVEASQPDEIIYSQAIGALRSIGEAVVEPIFDSIERGVDIDTRDGFAEVLASLEVEDERIYDVVVEVFEDEPELGAGYLAAYGDDRALALLHETFGPIEVSEQYGPFANHIFIELVDAIERLGGELTDEEQDKVRRAGLDRRGGLEPAIVRGEPGEHYEMTDDEREEANIKLARRRRKLRGGAKRKMKKAAKYARYRVEECLVSPDWETRRIANLIQVRSTPAGNNVLTGLLVDLGCLGPKDAMFQTDVSPRKASQMLAELGSEHEPCSPHLAAKIAREGALLAAHLDLPIPDEAFAVMETLNRYDPDRADEEVPLGDYGKPYFIPGPEDDVDAIVDHLDERLGPDGYEVDLPPWM